jgi:hypothetical protein
MREALTIRLTDDLAEALAREAKESGLPKGEIVRQAIAARLARKPAGSVMARYTGLIDGPADLSTNKAYRRRLYQRS